LKKNVKTDFRAKVSEPVIGSGIFVHPLKDMNKGVLHVNKALAKVYLAAEKQNI
jgi:hypothetical protein